MNQTRKHRTSSVKTRRLLFQHLPKCTKTRCRTYTYKVDGSLFGLQKPVIIKKYKEMGRFNTILNKLLDYRNTPKLIYDFSNPSRVPPPPNCDIEKAYNIIKQHVGVTPWTKELEPFLWKYDVRSEMHTYNLDEERHVLVYECVEYGDIKYLSTQPDNVVVSAILQITCILLQLGFNYHIFNVSPYHGNILIDSTTEKTLDYEINGEIFTIETHGIMPKIDDFWRFARFKDGIVWKVWDDVCYIVGSYFGSLIKNPELYTSIRTLRDGNKLETPRDVYNHVYSCCMV